MSADLREISLMIYTDVMEKSKYLHIEMNRALDKYDYLEKQEKAFIRRLVTGSTERCISIDYIINSFSKIKINKMKPFIRSLLRLSAYQILYMDNVADAVAVDEAVKLAKKHKFSSLAGFVNAILRNISRNKGNISLEDNILYEMPKELYDLVIDQYPDKARYIFDAYQKHKNKGTIIRINRSKCKDEKKLTDKLLAECVSEEMGCYRVISGNPAAFDEFDKGEFIIQDTAACLPVYLSELKENQAVLELCSAPGGKTIQAADMMNDRGVLISRDISEVRCSMIEEALDRCGFSMPKVSCCDARILENKDLESFDICFVDAPCSGIGVIGSKPDIKFHFNASGLEALISLQKEIVLAAVRTVKKGGILVYSTCSLNKNENEEIVKYASSLRPSHIVDLKTRLPKCFTEYEYKEGMITVFPQENICEGFFVGIIQFD